VQKCVVFLGPEQGDDIELAGTGFLISKGEPGSAVYLVTAAHVAKQLAGPIGVRLNTHEGQFRVQPLSQAEWVYHRHYPEVDVAAVLFDVPKWADVRPYNIGKFATQFKMATKDFGPGDFAYVVGLYRLLKDTGRNIPLVHTGHIAATALDHPVPVTDPITKRAVSTRAYLVESRAISGASGSPVFVRRSVKHLIPESIDANANKLRVSTPGSVWLLGMWQSSWPLEPDQALIEGAGLGPNVKVSVGIGLVIPSQYIIDVLLMPGIRDQRDEWLGARAVQVAATTDAVPATKADNPRHREDFNSLLHAAARKPPQGDQT
jgi:hypothetical protein